MNNPTNRGLVYVALITQLGIIASTWITHELKQAKTEEVKAQLEQTTKVEGKKLDEIHGLVNSRLTEALEEIKKLKEKLGVPETKDIPPK